MTYLLLILLIILFTIILIRRNNPNINTEYFANNKNLTYYKCKERDLGKITKSIFDINNIGFSYNNWDLYIPCGYNNVEEELKKILVKTNLQDKYIFGINGCDDIVSKNKIWESLVKCFGRKDASTLMPESYVLSDLNEMELFRKDFNPSSNYIYILKKNIQRKEGLKLTRDYFDIIDAKNESYRVVQRYITDLYLINQRKVNLRIYLLIIIRDNTVYFYLCDEGKCIYTNKKYNDDDLDFESNITSYHLDMGVYKNNPRDFKQLIQYINENNMSGEYLFDGINNLMKNVCTCLSASVFQSKNIAGTITFQLFGADVIFDNQLHPYLLEMNKGPDMSARDDIDEKMKNKVQTDMFKTVGLLENGSDNSFYLIYKSLIDWKR